jgi:hypothetical protein
MRVSVSDGYPAAPNPRFLPFFRKLGHYPFNGSFKSDCGLLGKRIDPASVTRPNARSRGFLDRFESPYNPRSVRMTGWFGSEEGAVRCVVLTDESLKVIGAAAYGHERADLIPARPPTGGFNLGFVGVAPAGAEAYRAFAVVSGRPGVYEVSGALRPAPPPKKAK